MATLYRSGILEGSDGLFHPDNTLTRAEAAAILSRMADRSLRVGEGAEAELAPAPGEGPDIGPGDEPDTEPDAEPGDEPGTEPGDKPGTEPGDELGTELGDEPGTELGDEPDTEPDTGPGEDPDREWDTE